MSCVYLLHIDPPFRGCSHYVGYTGKDTPDTRFAEHQNGKGASLTTKAVEAGHKLTLVTFWPNTTKVFENRLKAENATTRGRWKCWCPTCGLNEMPIPVPVSRDIRNPEILK